MMKVSLFLALTLVVASVSALQDAAANGGEAGPEPYAYAYQTDSHAASEQRDQQGRVTGFYTLTDADGRERRVEYVADEAGFRAKVATNEVGTKSENPANVEFVAAEPTPAQYSAAAQYTVTQGAYQAPAAQVQGAQYVRSQTYQTAAVPQVARSGYFQQQQYATRPAVYGNTGYYTTGYAAAPASAYGSSYNAAYGGYGANQATGYTGYTGYAPAGAYYTTTGYAPASYTGYTVSGAAAPATTGQYYSYRSSTVNGAAAAPVVPAAGAAGYSSAYRYRSATVPVGGVATYSAGFPAGVGASFGAAGPVGIGATASRSANYQGSSNYLVLQKRAAEKEEKSSN